MKSILLKATNRWLLFLLVGILLFSCKKDPGTGGGNGPGPGPDNGPGVVTPPGEPDGDVETKLIGVNGGEFTTADGRLTITIPAGALTSDMTLTVQPITNKVRGGAGKAYRITPHGVAFAKPVKITFTYDENDLENTIPYAMAIAYQDAQGIWQAVGNGVKDTANKKITISTTHFSDWALFKLAVLLPKSAVLAPGGTVGLSVVKMTDGDDLDLFVPLTPVKDSLLAEVKEWKLSGAGVLSHNGNHATYTAPGAIPALNPVAVSATLNTQGIGKYILVANIYIGEEGITFRIDNGSWMHSPCPLGVTTAGGYTIIEGVPIVNNKPAGMISLKWTNAESNTFHRWTLLAPMFNYSPGGTSNYFHFTAGGGGTVVSPGGIEFLHYFLSDPIITGVFELSKAGESYISGNTTLWRTHKIEGFFTVKRMN